MAAKLTNWKIDIKSESQFREILEKMQQEEVDGILDNIEEKENDVVEENPEELLKEDIDSEDVDNTEL